MNSSSIQELSIERDAKVRLDLVRLNTRILNSNFESFNPQLWIAIIIADCERTDWANRKIETSNRCNPNREEPLQTGRQSRKSRFDLIDRIALYHIAIECRLIKFVFN